MKDPRIKYADGTWENLHDNVSGIIQLIPEDVQLTDIESFSLFKAFGFDLEEWQDESDQFLFYSKGIAQIRIPRQSNYSLNFLAEIIQNKITHQTQINTNLRLEKEILNIFSQHRNNSNNMKNLAQKVKETIETGNYYFDIQYCHPERVNKSALEQAENTAEEYFSNITDEEIEKYTNETIQELGEETNVSHILTEIADRNCDHSGYETITCVVIANTKNI